MDSYRNTGINRALVDSANKHQRKKRAARSRPLPYQAFDAFERQHQAKRHTDFKEVLLAFGHLCNLVRDMPPGGLAAVLIRQVLLDQIPHVGEGGKLHDGGDGQRPRQRA
jgi:hypothetical protein